VSRRRFSVEWTEAALGDLDRLAVYLATESALRAEDILDRIVARAESLDVVPERGRFPPELRLVHNHTWREVHEPPWRILYRINGRMVEIHGVLDGRRNLQDILMERLLNA
jgi:toxin ParE1/3/4